MYNFNEVKENKEKILEWLKSEYRAISTGRAAPSVLDNVAIDMYGARTAIAHCAAISIEDAKTLRVTPWDKSVVREIEKAVYDADLGLSVSTDDIGLRVHFPALTGETRQKLVKVLKDRLEDSRIRVRSLREETNKDIDARSKDGEYGEDDKKRFRDEMQKIVDDANQELESIFEIKEKEVLGE